MTLEDAALLVCKKGQIAANFNVGEGLVLNLCGQQAVVLTPEVAVAQLGERC